MENYKFKEKRLKDLNGEREVKAVEKLFSDIFNESVKIKGVDENDSKNKR